MRTDEKNRENMQNGVDKMARKDHAFIDQTRPDQTRPDQTRPAGGQHNAVPYVCNRGKGKDILDRTIGKAEASVSGPARRFLRNPICSAKHKLHVPGRYGSDKVEILSRCLRDNPAGQPLPCPDHHAPSYGLSDRQSFIPVACGC